MFSKQIKRIVWQLHPSQNSGSLAGLLTMNFNLYIWQRLQADENIFNEPNKRAAIDIILKKSLWNQLIRLMIS